MSPSSRSEKSQVPRGNRRPKRVCDSLLLSAACVAVLCVGSGPSWAETLRVARPTPNAGPEKNPLKGFNSGWWNVDQEFASVGYQTLEWGQLEPSNNDFQFGYDENGNKRYLEEVLTRNGSKGRHQIIQLHVDWCCNEEDLEDNYKGPAWLKDEVGVWTIVGQDGEGKPRIATDYNDPRFLSEATEVITALNDYLRDDPRTFVVQTGVLGWWGEWHTFGLDEGQPGQVAKETIFNSYVDQLGSDGLTQVRFAEDPVNVPQRGVGYTNGWVLPTDHGYEFGEEIAERKLWRNGPVGGEVPPLDDGRVTADTLQRFFATDEGADFLAQGGYTNVLVPEDHKLEAKLGEWERTEQFEAMHRLLGYNYQVQEVRHLDARSDTGEINLEVDLENIGIAPFYKDWDVQLAVLDANGEVVDLVDVDFDLREFMPGDETTLSATLAGGIDPEEEMQLALRILQPGATDLKTEDNAWKWGELDPRNLYVVVSNDIIEIEGRWEDGSDHVFEGGWNVLDVTSVAIPEPTSGLLLLVAGVLVSTTRRRAR